MATLNFRQKVSPWPLIYIMVILAMPLWGIGHEAYNAMTAPLAEAVECKDIGGVNELLAAGANPNVWCNYGAGMTALQCAIVQGDDAIFKALLSHGATVDARGCYHETALMMAADKGRADWVKLLLAKGADPNLTDEKGKTVIEFAGNRDDVKAVLQVRPEKPIQRNSS